MLFRSDDGDGSFTSADQPAETYSDEALQHPIAGSVVTTGLLDGKAIYYGLERAKTYWLKETGAPLGFNLDSQVHEIIVGADGVINFVSGDSLSACNPQLTIPQPIIHNAIPNSFSHTTHFTERPISTLFQRQKTASAKSMSKKSKKPIMERATIPTYMVR